jgi:hypothetical protein
MEIQWRRSSIGFHEYFCPGEYDARESPSTLNEANWRINQHPMSAFKLVLDSEESASL